LDQSSARRLLIARRQLSDQTAACGAIGVGWRPSGTGRSATVDGQADPV